MAKKSSTIHIENCFWDLINDFMKENGIDSRNTAIECILSEYKALKGIRANTVKYDNRNNEDSTLNKNKTKENNEMYEKLQQMEDDMQD